MTATHYSQSLLKAVLAGACSLAWFLVAVGSINLSPAMAWQEDDEPGTARPDKVFDDQMKVLQKAFEVIADQDKKKDELEEQYRKQADVMQQTAAALSQIQNQGIQKQLDAMNSAMAANRLSDMMYMNWNNQKPNETPNQQNNRLAMQMILQNQKQAASYDAMIKSQEVQQLSFEQRQAMQARIAAYQEAVRVMEKYSQLQQAISETFESFWPLIDLEDYRSDEQDAEMLALLQKHGQDNAGAQLIQCFISLRNGRVVDAQACIARAEELDPYRAPLWSMLKAMAYWKLEDKKKCRLEMQNAIRDAGKDPKIQLLQGALQSELADWGKAQNVLMSLAKKSFHPVASHSLFVAACNNRGKKSPKEAAESLKHAQQLVKLTSDDNWHSQMVLAIALANQGTKSEALQAIAKAMDLATGSNIQRCQEIQSKIEADQPFDWSFF